MFLELQNKNKNFLFRLLFFKSSNSKSLLILSFFLSLFLLDVSKAENRDFDISEDNLIGKEYLKPSEKKEDYVSDLATIDPIFEDEIKIMCKLILIT